MGVLTFSHALQRGNWSPQLPRDPWTVVENKIKFLTSTLPGDPSGGPAESGKVIRVEMDEIGAKRFLASTIRVTRRI